MFVVQYSNVVLALNNSEYCDHRVRNRVSVSAHSARAYPATLLVMVNVVKGGGRAPPPSPAWANFTLMIEFAPESDCCFSVYSVIATAWCPQQSLSNGTLAADYKLATRTDYRDYLMRLMTAANANKSNMRLAASRRLLCPNL